MADLTGTSGSDTLTGTEGDDIIDGLGGFDQIDGKGGNDTINGGADGDSIQSGAGDDLVNGGDGNDFIGDFGGGSDTLRGGAGADSISVSHFGPNDTVETVAVEAGVDDDRVDFNSSARGTASIDLGDGADRLLLGTVSNATLTVATGAGRDTVTLQQFAFFGTAPVFTDFTTGDVFDLGDFLARNASGWDGSNPFGAGGYLRLVQSGADTLLRFDRDGAAGTMSAPIALARFGNTDATAFTAANFGGYAPDGSPVQGATITGTAGSDTLTGTVGDDVINGLAGFDQIDGRNGNDVINGGADRDNIRGGFGDDVIDGGDGDDFISDDGGSDTLRGGAGNDDISVFHSPAGVNIGTETIRVEGGAGDDRVSYFVFTGGSGAIDLGDGADRLTLGNGPSAVRATLGAGRDRVELSSFAAQNAIPVITDFTGGAEGDNIEITSNFTSGLQNYDGSNPFGVGGYLRLVRSGADTLFQIDRDGAAGRNAGFTTLARLEGTDASTLTAENFSGFAPTVVNAADLATAFVTAPASVTEGTDARFTLGVTLKNVTSVNTTISMTFLADRSTATNGADVTVGSFSGTYSITQSTAGDYRIDLGSIAVLDDALVEGDETVAIRVTATGQLFENGTDSTVVFVTLRSDDAGGTAGADTLTGTAEGDLLRGLGGNDTLFGLAGDDRLEGGRGNDVLWGGAGADSFLFDPIARGERDVIRDFGADDRLLSTVRLADGNRDGVIGFGKDRALDIGQGDVRVFSDAGKAVDKLVFRGEVVEDGVTYYAYGLMDG